MKKLIARIILPLLVATSSLAQSGSQKPQNEIIMSQEAARAGWGMNASTITNVITRNAGKYTEMIFDGGTWTISNHVQFSAGLTRVVIQPGTRFYVGTTNNLAFAGDDFQSGPDNIFYGPGVVTGTVNGLWGCWTNWNALTTPANYYLRCTGLNPQANFIETTNQFGGDVYGVYTNLQLGTGVVTTVEILDNTVATNDINTNVWTFVGSVVTNLATTNWIERSDVKIGGGVMPFKLTNGGTLITNRVVQTVAVTYIAGVGYSNFLPWIEVDCAGVVPTGAYAVILSGNLNITDDALWSRVQLRIQPGSGYGTQQQVGEATIVQTASSLVDVGHTWGEVVMPLSSSNTFRFSIWLQEFVDGGSPAHEIESFAGEIWIRGYY